ncbi:MAG: rhamnan synthesis F family protein, partial [Caldimonas sp.]
MGAAERWVVYATFDPNGESAAFAVDQLLEYRRLGFSTLVVDTSPRLSARRATDWGSSASAWFQRPNVGYDFASYRAGVEHLIERQGVDPLALELILANDSCFGPFFPMDRVLDRLSHGPAAETGRVAFGMTDSYQFTHHLQSYWMLFRPDVTPLVVQFLRTMPTAADRDGAIELGELGLSRHLKAAGCELRAFCSIDQTLASFSRNPVGLWSLVELGVRRLLDRPRYNRCADTQCLRYLLRRPSKLPHMNSCLLFGSHMYHREMLPLIKRSLLRDNVYEDPRLP